MIERINGRVRGANRRYLPFWAFLGLALAGGLVGALLILPWLAERMWQLHEPWGLNGSGWFFGASVSSVAFLFGMANLFLRMLGCDALEVKLPPSLAGIRKRAPNALSWFGLVPVAIGLVIGKTIFT